MLFTITEACTRCGICAEVCPARIIEFKTENAVPTPTDDAESRCIQCGHCVAVCPHGAISLETMPVDRCPPVMDKKLIEPDNLKHFFMARRSMRAFIEEPVSRDELAKLMDIARYAPTGSNSRQVKWIAVYKRRHVEVVAGIVADFFRAEIASEIAKDPASPLAKRFQRVVDIQDSGFDYICRGAPHLLLAYTPDSRGAVDGIIAATYLELAAFSAGLGPCWGGFVMAAGRNNWPELRKYLQVPPDHTISAAMLIGRPKYAYRRIPLRNEAETLWID
jgi:ferredoxin